MNLNFSENFKQLRKEKGYTQEKIAEVLGVTGQTISRWELGMCYPDIELLPSIANYFGVTVDILLSNDNHSKEKDRDLFYEKLDTLECSNSTERIDFVKEYCRKYPENDEYAFQLIRSIDYYACGNEERCARFMPILLKTAEKLMDTQYRYAVIQEMAKLCAEEELDTWLNMVPYAGGFSRRDCLISRVAARGDFQNSYVQEGLNMIETLASQLDVRCPDQLGSKKKAIYQREVLQVIESFGCNGEVPDGWKMFYAYKQLVLAACLFGQKRHDEAWAEFDSAIEKCKYIFSLDAEWLPIGGMLFSNLKVSKDWNYAVDEEGRKHKLFRMIRLSFYHISTICDLLTNERWAWFNSVRDTEKFQAAVEWAREMEKTQEIEL